MSSSQTKCSVCGGSDMNLVDGYYYCIECGTQDMTLQETMLETTNLVDGNYVIPVHKKKLVQLKENVEMAPEWHKWHTYNFILAGLADELIELGAKPSFKVKVLWIWTRYLNKYHEKIDDNDGSSNGGSEDDEKGEKEALEEDDTENEEEEYKPGIYAYNTDIKLITLGLLYAMCYVALNLDESDIQLSDLCRFIREEKVSRKNCFKFIPKGLNLHSIPQWQNFMNSSNKLCLTTTINYLSLVLFKKLNLGSPKVPDFHKLVDKFITELCLPKDVKYIVLALAKQIKYIFIENKRTAYVPDYEIIAMAYILMSMKLCFGLDDNYEVKLSDAVEKINDDESRIKSYSGIYNETDRLFSFREWYKYVELRKIILCKYNSSMAIHNNQDVDDDLYVLEMKDRFKRYHSIKVRDKIVMEILDKINPGTDEFKLSKVDFKSSLTPLTSYTETLLSYTNDPDLKLMLSEDFSAYSISYITNGLDLRVEEKNILTGVSKDGKIFHEEIKGNIPSRRAGSPLVYVRNCENKNWLVTKPPKQEHITETKENIDAVPDDHDDSTTIQEISERRNMSDTVYKSEMSTDLEEDSDLNIFDDSFKDIKDEGDTDQINEDLCEEGNLNDQIESAFELNSGSRSVDQHHNEENSINSPLHVSKLLNRDEIIRALIERKCREFSIPLPSDLNPKSVLKRKTNAKDNCPRPRKYKNRATVPVEMTTHEIISSYFTKLKNDFEESWKNSFRDCFRQNTLLQNVGIEQNPNKIETDLNSIDEAERQISSCVSMENTDNDSVVICNDDVATSDQELQSSVPEDNPEFDEKIYDIDQLYVKMKNRKIDQVFFETDPQLVEILGKDGYIDRHVKKATEKIEIMKSRSQSNTKTVKLKPLINLRYNIQEYGYWIRYYAGFALERNRFINQRFEDELDDSFPRSFTYVLRLCASILECTTVVLYTQLCRQEKLLERRRKRKVNIFD